MSRISGSHLILLCLLLVIRLVHCLLISLCHSQNLRCVWRCHTSVTVAVARKSLRTRLTYYNSVRYYWRMDPYLTVSLVSGDTSWNVPVPLSEQRYLGGASAEQKMWPNRSLKFSVSFLPCWLKLCTMVVISVSLPVAKLRQNDHILCRRAFPFLSASFASFSLFSFLLFVFYLNFKASFLDWLPFKLLWCPWLNSIFVFKMKPGWATTKLLCVPWPGVCCVISSIHNRGVF